MLSKDTIQTIQRLLEEGQHSQRQIARQLGVGRNQVSEIARGRRPDYDTIRDERQRARMEARQQVEFGRCSECGAKARLPCLVCLARRRVHKMRRRDSKERVTGSYTLRLRLRRRDAQRFNALLASRRHDVSGPEIRS